MYTDFEISEVTYKHAANSSIWNQTRPFPGLFEPWQNHQASQSMILRPADTGWWTSSGDLL